ncbi:hypothetical protein [Sphingomonas sp.]|uniref:hypothetical protein n=1 Tax=Sphingomonas sp. TaxID=28214 RepID=UPI003CC5672D
MADEQFPGEDELENRQDAGLYPLGRALRATYRADNHDSLGQDLTGLMLELARIEPGVAPPDGHPTGAAPIAGAKPVAALATAAPAIASPAPPPRRPWWRAVFGS